MILKVVRQSKVSSLEDLIHIFDAKRWIDENINIYEHHVNTQDMMTELLTDFFADYKGTVSILSIGDHWIVTEYVIKYVITYKGKIIPCNTLERAEDVYSKIAIRALQNENVYRTYPKQRIDFSVLKSMVESLNINLKLIS